MLNEENYEEAVVYLEEEKELCERYLRIIDVEETQKEEVSDEDNYFDYLIAHDPSYARKYYEGRLEEIATALYCLKRIKEN
ncbi:hypothetical protein NSS82_19170 [Paenibacillus sp. FSL H7-0735]|uniref:hypothetical protein n=1 Tax=Paenibacillus sp. FSL H7-0735 TaxID=2954736 RepID=UPI0030F72DF7